jgi:hypothetical protein
MPTYTEKDSVEVVLDAVQLKEVAEFFVKLLDAGRGVPVRLRVPKDGKRGVTFNPGKADGPKAYAVLMPLTVDRNTILEMGPDADPIKVAEPRNPKPCVYPPSSPGGRAPQDL